MYFVLEKKVLLLKISMAQETQVPPEWNASSFSAQWRRSVKTRAERFVGVSPSRSRPACLSYQTAISIYFPHPATRVLHNAADFVSVAWRSRKVFQRVLRARAAGIGPSIRFPRYKRDATTSPRCRLLIVHVASSHLFIRKRLLIIYSPSPLARCLPVVSLAFRFTGLALLSARKISSHPFSATGLFPVKFFGSLYTTPRHFILIFPSCFI